MTRLEITEGIVLGKRGSGEANTIIVVLTERLGLVRAAARSARREKSKLRYGLEPFTAARFSFVQGKYEWKMIGAERISREVVFAPLSNRAAAGRIARLLLRLIQGEEPAEELYGDMAQGLVLLARAKDKEELQSIECVLVLRALSILGYLPKTAELSPYVEGRLSTELAASAVGRRSALIRAINDSLSASGL